MGVTNSNKPGSSKKSLDEKTTYRFGNRSFVVEPVFRQDGPDTLGSILLRLMKSESEAKYIKDPDNPKRWIVDEEAAQVVRRIYRMTLDGYGTEQIAASLEQDGRAIF